MNTVGFGLFPLQAVASNLSDFQLRMEDRIPQIAIFLVGVTIIVVTLLVINAFRKRGKVAVLNEGYVPTRRPVVEGRGYFSVLRLAKSMGLDREQTKMLAFVMKNVNVRDMEKALESSDVMDRHFKRAYNNIEETSTSDDDLNKRLSVLFATRNILETYTGTVNISSTRQIKEGTAAILIVEKDGANHPTKIVSSKPDALVVEHPLDDKGSPIGLQNGGPVTVAFFGNSNKAFSVPSRIIGSQTVANRAVLKLAHSGKIKKLSSRRFRRKQAGISAGFYLVKVEASVNRKKKTLLVSNMRLAGDIMDISIGGCAIRTSVSIRPGQTIKIEFSKENNFTVAALGEVIRTNQTGRNTVMHVKFLKIPRKSLNYINAMVYEYAKA